MRELVAATDAATWHDAALRDAFLGTLDYEVDVLQLLAAYRAMVLRQAQWHDTGSARRVRRSGRPRATRTEALAAAHVETLRRATSTTRRTT